MLARCKWSPSHSPPGFTKIAKHKSPTSRYLPDQPQNKSHTLLTNIPLEINDSHLSLKWTRNRPALLHPLNHTRARDPTVDSGRLYLWRQRSSRWPSGDQSARPLCAALSWLAGGLLMDVGWVIIGTRVHSGFRSEWVASQCGANAAGSARMMTPMQAPVLSCEHCMMGKFLHQTMLETNAHAGLRAPCLKLL